MNIKLEIINLRRKVFLLSYTEVGGGLHNSIPTEGIALKYFDSPERRKAEGEGATSWWLRTPNFVDRDYISIITGNGVLSSICLYDKLNAHNEGIRPAIAVNPNVKITKIFIGDKEVYILKK